MFWHSFVIIILLESASEKFFDIKLFSLEVPPPVLHNWREAHLIYGLAIKGVSSKY